MLRNVFLLIIFFISMSCGGPPKHEVSSVVLETVNQSIASGDFEGQVDAGKIGRGYCVAWLDTTSRATGELTWYFGINYGIRVFVNGTLPPGAVGVDIWVVDKVYASVDEQGQTYIKCVFNTMRRLQEGKSGERIINTPGVVSIYLDKANYELTYTLMAGGGDYTSSGRAELTYGGRDKMMRLLQRLVASP